MNSNDGKTWFGLGIDNSGLRSDADKSMNIFNRIGDKAEAEGKRIDNTFKRIAGGMAGAFAASVMKNIISDISRVRNEFEQLEISFNVMLGSREKANRLMQQALRTAIKTPFDLGQVASGYKRLLAYGIEFEKLDSSLKMLGDIASGVSAPLNDIVYLYGTLKSQNRAYAIDIRQFASRGIPIYEELAKVLGVNVEKVNDFVSDGLVGFKEVEQAFKNMTGEGGKFNNLMEAQSKSIGGMKSNLGDAISQAKNDIGKKLEPLIKGSLKTSKELVENYEEIGRTIMGLAVAYGSYKAVLITVSAIEHNRRKILALINGMAKVQMALNKAITKSEAVKIVQNELLTKALYKQAAAQIKANLAALANPYVLAAAAVAALSYGLYRLITADTAAEKAQKLHNKEIEEAARKKENLLSTTKDLVRKIKDETNTIYQQVEAWRQLKKEMPGTFGKMTLSEFKGMSETDIDKLINTGVQNKDLEDFNRLLSDAQTRVENLRRQLNDAIAIPNNSGAVMYLSRQLSIAEETLKLKQAEKHERDEIAKQAEFEAKPDAEKLRILKQQLEAYKQQYAELEKQVPEAARSGEAFSFVKTQVEDAEAGLLNVNTEWGKFDAQTSINILKLNALNGNIKQIEGVISGINSAASKGISYAQAKSEAQAAYEKASMELEEIKRNAAGRTQKEYEDASKRLEETKKAYEELGGVTKKSQKSDADTRLEKAKRLAAFTALEKKQGVERARIVSDLEFAVEQARIDSLADSSEKVQAQMKLNHKKEVEELRREREDYLQQKIEADKALFEADPKNKGKVYSGGANIVLTEAEKANFAARENYINEKQKREKQQLIDLQRQTMNEYLAEYGQYMERRQAITELYAEKINKAQTQGEKLKLGEEMKKELAAVDDEVQKKTSVITRLFEDMREKSVSQMRGVADEAQAMLDFVNSGEYKADNVFGLTKEQFDMLSKSPEKLKAVRDEIENVRREADASETSLNKMANGLEKIFSAGGNYKKLKEGFSELESGFNDVAGAAQFVANSISGIAEATGSGLLEEVANGLNVALDAASSAMEGAKAGSVFGPIGAAAGAALGLVSSLTKNLSKLHDAKHERKIQNIQKNIDTLKSSYDELGNRVEKAYSKDASKMIEQQNVMLKQQQILIRQQIEQEKQKKKADKNKIAEWERTYRDINRQIEENKTKAVDVIFGEDVQTAIENFADAYVSAWEAGDDKAKSSKELAKKMIRSMIVEAMKASIGDTFMQNLRDKMKQFMDNDNRIDEAEQSVIDKMIEGMTKRLDEKFGWADKYLKGSIEQGAASYGAYEKITQEQASSIDGRLTGIHLETVRQSDFLTIIVEDANILKANSIAMNEVFSEVRNLSLLSVGHLEKISKNTHELFEINERLGKIEQNTSRI